jgi:hypothetical protein
MPPTTPYAGKFNPSPYNNNHNLHKYHQPMEASYGDMCYHDNSLVSGSLEALIQHLVPTVDYYPDVSLISKSNKNINNGIIQTFWGL